MKSVDELYSEAHLQGYLDYQSGCQNMGAHLGNEFDRIDYENGYLRALQEASSSKDSK